MPTLRRDGKDATSDEIERFSDTTDEMEAYEGRMNPSSGYHVVYVRKL
jgi:hypothetical protein